MSAQSILFALTPAVPAAPQGAASTAVSGFEGLLAAMFQMADADEATPKPAVPAEVDADKVVGFLAAPPMAPPTETLVIAEAATGETPPSAPVEPVAPPPPEPAGSKAEAPVSVPQAAEPVETAVPIPAEVAAPAPTDEELEAAVVAGKAAEVAAQTRSATQAPPVQAPQTTPPPLRPLAERTSRPQEEVSKDAGTPSEASKTGTAEVPPDQAQAFEVAAAPTDAQVPPPADVEPLPMDAVQIGEGEGETAPTQASTTHAAREGNPSVLSRGAVEATAQIAAQIIRRLEGRSTRFEMALLPEELGRVDVKLEIGADGRLAARLAFDNPLAATDLRGRADELRRELEAQGFQMADDAFEFTQRDSGSHAFDRGQDSRSGHGRAFSSAARLNTEADIVQSRWTQISLSPAGVDLKV